MNRANWIDSLVEYLAPHAGLRRRAARGVLAAYEAATPSRQRKFRRDSGGPDQQVLKGAVPIRTQARHLDQNHDIARGILRTLVNNTVGPNGIGIEPQPRRADGTIHEEYAKALREGWRDWCRAPEVTGRLHWARACRMMARTWYRDGEAFAQELIGGVPFLDHGTRVPYSLELFEPDLVPMDYTDGDRIRQGIERNAWGKPVGYWVYKKHPGENMVSRGTSDLKRISADRMLHLAFLDRLGQLRGVSEFASVITRLEDIKDYEESERVAAKIAAMFTAYIRKGTPELYNPENTTDKYADGTAKPRDMRLAPGMIIDNLIPGEEVGMIDSNRPNPNLITFRQGQLRAVAAGAGASSSSISRDYNGTFSSQRQELVEQWIHYATLTDDFTGQLVQPVWERFVFVAHLSGVIPRPADVPEALADDALYVAQAMPWIDPYKEAMSWELLVKAGFASEVEVMRRRGANPRDVMEQITTWRNAAKEKELVFSSDAANDTGTAPPAAAADPAQGDPTPGNPAQDVQQ